MERTMTRFSRCAMVALAASLALSAGVPARADVGGSDIDILCHEQVRPGWPCPDRDILSGRDFAYRTAAVDRAVRHL
jgi:hypothetical protein